MIAYICPDLLSALAVISVPLVLDYCNRQPDWWMQDSILVAGYPLGGDSLSITKGIVSRVLFCACSTPIQQKRCLQRCMTAHSLCNAYHVHIHTEFD